MKHSTVLSWTNKQQVDQAERERLAILAAPTPKNPPELLAPVRCKVLRRFFVAGQGVEIGDMVTLPAHDAKSMQALGRVEIL